MDYRHKKIKIATLILSAMFATLAFAGCIGGDESTEEPLPEQGPPEGETPQVVFEYFVSGCTLIVDAKESNDPAGLPLRFRWDFGDGTLTEWGVREMHEYDYDGSYTVTLTADNGHVASTASVTVDIAEGSRYDDICSDYTAAYLEGESEKADKWAVVEGVSDYPPIGVEGGDDLPDCHIDALIVRDYLVNSCNFSDDRVFLFMNESDCPANLKNAVNFIAAHSSETSTFVYYHSGHGTVARVAEDDVIEAGICICDDGWGKTLTVPMSDLKEWFSVLKSKKFVFITDSCQTGEMAGIGPNQFGVSLSEGLSAEGRIIISGSSDATLAYSTGVGGAFTIAFLNGTLYGDGCSETVPPDIVDVIGEKDGMISVEEAFWYTWWMMETGREGLHIYPSDPLNSVVGPEQLPEMRDEYEGEFFL